MLGTYLGFKMGAGPQQATSQSPLGFMHHHLK
jgi:hypothetical protein